jgi:hypothetical protein
MPTVEIRKAHVKRIYRLNDDGTIDHDVWVDILRIDAATVAGRGFRDQVSGLLTNSVFKWLDDGKTPGGDVRHENVNQDRRTTKLTVSNPELADGDHSTDVLLYIVRRSRIKFPHSPVSDVSDGRVAQMLAWVFDNVPADGSDPGEPPRRPSNRKVKVIRVVNNDLGGLDMINPVTWDAYKKALARGVVDKSQYLDAEVVDNFHLDYRQGQGGAEYQVIEYVLQNKAVIQIVDAGGAGKTSDGRTTKKYRLDPIETVVNVHWQKVTLTVQILFDFAGVTVICGGATTAGVDDQVNVTSWYLNDSTFTYGSPFDTDGLTFFTAGTGSNVVFVESLPSYGAVIDGANRITGTVTAPGFAFVPGDIRWDSLDGLPASCVFDGAFLPGWSIPGLPIGFRTLSQIGDEQVSLTCRAARLTGEAVKSFNGNSGIWYNTFRVDAVVDAFTNALDFSTARFRIAPNGSPPTVGTIWKPKSGTLTVVRDGSFSLNEPPIIQFDCEPA